MISSLDVWYVLCKLRFSPNPFLQNTKTPKNMIVFL